VLESCNQAGTLQTAGFAATVDLMTALKLPHAAKTREMQQLLMRGLEFLFSNQENKRN